MQGFLWGTTALGAPTQQGQRDRWCTLGLVLCTWQYEKKSIEEDDSNRLEHEHDLNLVYCTVTGLGHSY